MNRTVSQFLIPMILTALPGCPIVMEHSGEKRKIDTVITFLTENNMPIVNELVYVREKLVNTFYTSEVLHTDNNGSVYLSGEYCVPVFVDTRGGGVRIDSSEIVQDTYVVVVRDTKAKGVDEIYGPPPTDPDALQRTGAYAGC